MAAATGLVIDIPVIIRSLSRDFYRSALRNNYSIPLDHDFLLALDAGIIAPAIKIAAVGTPAVGTTASHYLVNEFFCSWWTDDDLDFSIPHFAQKILDVNNIDECLTFHRHQITLLPAAVIATDSPIPANPFYIWKPNASNAITESDTCTRCRLYRAVAMGTLEVHREIRNQIQAMEDYFSTQKELSIRRSAGFHQLFEYLVIKEEDPAAAAAAASLNVTHFPVRAPVLDEEEPLPALKTSKKGKKGKQIAARRAVAENVRKVAISEVARLQNTPSLKWTWGVSMDESDLPFLNRYGDPGRGVPHSGYDNSLTHGLDTRSHSTYDVGDMDAGFFSDVSGNVRQPVDDLDLNAIPSCLYMNIRNAPNRYLVGFRDHSVDPMDDILPAQAAVPFNVPPPQSNRVLQAPIDESRYFSIHDFRHFFTSFKSSYVEKSH